VADSVTRNDAAIRLAHEQHENLVARMEERHAQIAEQSQTLLRVQGEQHASTMINQEMIMRELQAVSESLRRLGDVTSSISVNVSSIERGQEAQKAELAKKRKGDETHDQLVQKLVDSNIVGLAIPPSLRGP
jgi:anion-transporting  ArsA/GET3 family ATPase